MSAESQSIPNTSDINILEIPDNTRYWFVRANSGAKYYDDFLNNNFIAIGDNEIKLNQLNDIEEKYQVNEKILLKQYKNIFSEILLKQYNSIPENQEKNAEDQKREKATILRSSAKSATTAYRFIEEMDIGDIVLVPGEKTKRFLIGIVTSDTFDYSINHVFIPSDEDPNENNYEISDYSKKRRVFWIKEILLSELPEKLLWIRFSHPAINNITQNADSINSILANMYTYKGKMHLRVGVETQSPVTVNDWFAFQTAIRDAIGPKKANDIIQKPRVESPGQVILETVQQNWKAILFVGGILFGSVKANFAGDEVHLNGLLAYFYPSVRAERKHKQTMNKLQEDSLRKDNKLKGLEILKQSRLLKTNENNEPATPISIEKDTQQSLNDMKLTDATVGTLVSDETQRESLPDDLGQSQTKTKQSPTHLDNNSEDANE